MKLKRSVFLIGALVLIMIYTTCGKRIGFDRERTVTVIVERVKKGNIDQYLDLTGQIVGKDEVKVYSDVPGKVAKIVKYEGNYVYKDSPIAYIDRSQVGADYALAPVRSPISGYVTAIYVSPGQAVNPGTVPIASVGNINALEVIVNVPESRVGEIQHYQRVLIKVPAFPNKIFYGKVYRKDLTVDPLSRTLVVRVSIDESKGLLPGMYADVSILLKSAQDIFILPNSAVFETDGKYDLYLNISNTARLRNVEVLFTYKDMVAVKSGITTNDEVVTFGREFLKDGIRINPVYEKEEGGK